MDKKEKIGKARRIVNDDLTLRLWSRCVTEEEQNDVSIMKALLEDVQREPYPGRAKTSILKRMLEDGAGFDGLNAAMMTYGYLKHICQFYIDKASKK